MKILIGLANYGTNQIKFLERMLEEFSRYRFELHLLVDTTVDLNLILKKTGIEFTQRLFDESVGIALPYKHREYFCNHVDEFDCFLYSENDLLILESSLQFIVQQTLKLANDEIIGFYRYELKDGKKYLTDHDVKTPLTFHHAWRRGDSVYFTPFIQHSGCYFLTRSQLQSAIDSKGYVHRPHTGPYGVLEQGASDIYTQCGFKPKFLPLPIDPVLVHHLPDKYINGLNTMPRFTTSILEELQLKLGSEPILKINNPPGYFSRKKNAIKYNLRNIEFSIRHAARKRFG